MVNSVIYKAIFEAFSEASILTDCSGKILLFNKKAEVLLNVTLQEAEGKNLTVFFGLNHSTSTIKSFDNLFDAAATEVTVISDYIILKPDNVELCVELSMQRIVVDNEEYIYIIIKDITEKNNSELLLLENESKLSAIIENTADSIFAVDIERNIIYLNEEIGRDRKSVV